jgi:hypothetical protein
MEAGRPYGEFYDFDSVSLDYVGYHHVCYLNGHAYIKVMFELVPYR